MIFFLKGKARSGIRARISGTSMLVPEPGGFKGAFTSSGEYHHSGQSPLNETTVRPEVVHFRQLVLFPWEGLTEM